MDAGKGLCAPPGCGDRQRPTKSPTQDNIKQVVEIKFDGDDWGTRQEADYRTISGPGKLAVLTPKDCACDDPDRKKKTQNLKNEVLKEDVLEALDALAGKGRGGRRSRLPKKLPNLKD